MRNMYIYIIAVVLLARTSVAHYERMVHLKDRQAEMDLVVVAHTVEKRFAEIQDAPDQRRYIALADLLVQQVLKGDAVTTGDILTVGMARPTALALLAEEHVDLMDNETAIWMLRECEDHVPAPFYCVFRNKPDTQANLEPYTQAFRASARRMREWEAIQLEVSIPEQGLMNEQPFQASVSLRSTSQARNRLPTELRWKNRIQFILEEDVDGYQAIDYGPGGLAPYLAVLEIDEASSKVIPQSIAPSSPAKTNLKMCPFAVRAREEPTAFYCYARLVDEHGITLIQSRPVKIHIGVPPADEKNESQAQPGTDTQPDDVAGSPTVISENENGEP